MVAQPRWPLQLQGHDAHRSAERSAKVARQRLPVDPPSAAASPRVRRPAGAGVDSTRYADLWLLAGWGASTSQGRASLRMQRTRLATLTVVWTSVLGQRGVLVDSCPFPFTTYRVEELCICVCIACTLFLFGWSGIAVACCLVVRKCPSLNEPLRQDRIEVCRAVCCKQGLVGCCSGRLGGALIPSHLARPGCSLSIVGL